ERRSEVEAYIFSSKNSSDIERLSTTREKTGVFTGAYAINPANNQRVPIWTADYVLGTYGTGAVMAVPAHDQRDYEFSRKFNLPIIEVIRPADHGAHFDDDCAYEEYGVMCNSDQFDSLTSEAGKGTVTEWLDSRGFGKFMVTYRLRDWLISRQRYWGAPIPIVHCPGCGLVPVPEDQLPVLLPEGDIDFTPRGTSPLGACEPFMAVKCPKCGGSARRDPDTMDTFVDSSWYFLRYLSTDCCDCAFDEERVNRWLPVDVYVGGPEHATGHLIYARYITKYLHSRGFIEFDEPAKRMIHQGIITYNGQRMSKSKGNVVNPDGFVDEYGSDCFRMYLMFMGDFMAGGEWSDESEKGIGGIQRFQGRVWRLIRGLVVQVGDVQQYIS
ncbi:MAG: class I tRNA ligase family protein, partial [Candidatus Electryoneaceae bacterium]|nr:class I tRNA ligase family protein [Candidatus Electryoneaceae bacterium]